MYDSVVSSSIFLNFSHTQDKHSSNTSLLIPLVLPDASYPSYTGYEDFTPVNVPLFLNLKSYLTRGGWQPLVSVSAGVYCPNLEGMADVGIGLNYRLSRTSNVYFLLSVRTTPYGDFRKYTSSVIGGDRNFSAYYPGVAWTPSFKVGCTF